MSHHAAAQDPLHVLYVGSSPDLGTLRRLMEARGAVTRCRLTPRVAVVIADSSVPADHPTVRTAGTLGIPVMEAAEAIVQFADWRSRGRGSLPAPPTGRPLPAPQTGPSLPASPAEPDRPAPATRRSWSFRRSAR
ncbi:MAG: hypothetical protein WCF33_24585 [Pseudonocardiaceae bacterium]